MTTTVTTAGRSRAWAIDVGSGLAVAALWFVALEVGIRLGWRPRDPGAWQLVGACTGVAVGVRRVANVWLLAALAVAYPFVYFRPLISDFHLVPILVLGFVGAQEVPRRLWVVLASCGASVALLFSPLVGATSRLPADIVDAAVAEPFDPYVPGPLVGRPPTNWSDLALAEVATLSVILLGAALASQRAAADALAVRNRELERLRRVDAERAVADERVRISRDVHDVVAHHLTAILMRAQAAHHVREAQPGEAREAVAWIAEQSREALRSTRSSIASLRGDPAATPGPGSSSGLTADLGQLVDRLSEVGLPVRLSARWDTEPVLDEQVGVAVRRSVQESLTNVLKHAHATQAVVDLREERGGLGVRIVDDGTAAPATSRDVEGGGTGLIGMQERLAACGGRLRYGPSSTGGWEVALWVPTLGGGAA